MTVELKRIIEALRAFGPASAAIAGAMAARTLAQALSLWLIARALGPDGYGAITAVVAIAGAFGYLLAFGSPMSMINAVAKGERALPLAWRETVAAGLASTPMLLLSYAAVVLMVLPRAVPPLVVACFAIAEIVVMPMCQACVYACIAADRRGDAAKLTLLPALVRLAFAAALWPAMRWIGAGNALPIWSVMYLASAFLALLIALRYLRPLTQGSWPPAWHGLGPAVRQGFPFAAAGIAQKLASDADKALLASLASLHAAGIYGLAYRMLEMAQMPLQALGMAIVTHLARRHEHGHRAAMHDLLHILPIPMAYALLATPALFGVAWLIPWVFGPAFAGASAGIRALAFLPLVMAPRIQIQASLNAAGLQGRVARSHFAGAAIGIGMNLCLIPRSGMGGAIISAYFVESAVLLMQGYAMYSACARERAMES